MLSLDEYLKISKTVIKKHGFRRMLDNDDAISYVANFLMKADSKYNGVYGSIEGFRWLYGRFAIKNWIARYSKNKKNKVVNMSEVTELSIKSSDSVLNNVQLNEVLNYIDTLPQEQKDVIYMYYFEKKSLREIGSMFNLTPEAIRLRIKKVLNTIKENFDDKEDME